MARYESFLTVSTENSSNSSIHVVQKVLAYVPPNWLEKAVIGLLTPILLWMVIFLLTGKEGLPGGQVFALLVIIFGGIGAGYVLQAIKLPPLLGMLAVGIIIRNVPKVNFGEDLKENVSSPLRQIALVVILIIAGLGLNPIVLRGLSGVVFRLTFTPCLVEATVLAIVSYFILGLPWAWGFLLGFTIAAASPAVIVPSLLNLYERGYGVEKGIPTLVIAAASADDIFAISAFGVALGFIFSQNQSMTMTILHGPIEVVLGITFGVLWGLLLGLFFGRKAKKNKMVTVFRLLFTFAGGCLSLFGFHYIQYSGAGPLGCLTSTFVAAMIWRSKRALKDNDNLNWALEKLWFIFQPLLFGLIGCEIDLHNLDTKVVILGLICLCIALACRIVTSFLVVAGADLTIKERAFIAMAWLPKATVQAAIGPVAYDLAKQLEPGPVRDLAEKRGLEVLTIAVLAILLTAPVGSIAIMAGGPLLLANVHLPESDADIKTSVLETLPIEKVESVPPLTSERELNDKTTSHDIIIHITSSDTNNRQSDGGDGTGDNEGMNI